MVKVIPGPDLTGRGRDGVPLPRSALHTWWIRHGILLCAAGFALSLVLMAAGTWRGMAGLPYAEEYQRWGLWMGLANVVAYLDILTQRVIRRLTQIIAMFTTDVPPMQHQHGDLAGPSVGRTSDRASVVQLYRDVKERSGSTRW